MGAVHLTRRQVENDDLPSMCMRCGRPATVRRTRVFSKSQEWTFALIIFGGLPYFIAGWIFRNCLSVRVPMCDQHRNHFHWQRIIAWGGGALVAALAIGGLALIPQLKDEHLALYFKVVGGIAAAWVVIFLINRLTSITAATVNADDAIIVGVSDRFAKACEKPRLDEVEVCV